MQLPLFEDLKKYSKSIFGLDILAGLTVAIMLIPQGMAYGLLAGMPAHYGLYAGLVPLLIYPFFGSSKYLSVGPVAIVSIIIVSGLSELSSSPAEFIELAILTSVIAGLIQMVLAFFRMGFLVNFLSHPVIAGFTSAAAFIIGLSQLKYIFGITVPRSSTVIGTVNGLIDNISDWNMYAFIIGIIGLAAIVILKKIKKSIPGALIVTILSIIFVTFSGWEAKGLDLVREVPPGLPSFQMPSFSVDKVLSILPLAFIICLISFIESLSIAKTLGAKNKHDDIDANKELLGLGLAKFIGGFFQAFPNTGSFTRSAINEQAGAKTGMSSIFAAGFIGIVLLFFTQWFYFLPKAILAAVVISAVFGLVDYKEAIHLYKSHKRDFLVFITTFILTLVLGVQIGVFAGIALSLMVIIQRISKRHFAVLGKVPGSSHYRNMERFPDSVAPDDTLIFRYDGDLFFGNVEHFYTSLMSEIHKKKGLKYLVLNMTALESPDSSTISKIEQLIDYCNDNNITLKITDVIGPMRDRFRKWGLTDRLGKEHLFLSVEDACKSI